MRRARPGSPQLIPRARDQNAILDAAGDLQRPVDPEPTEGTEPVLIQNDTGADVEAWTILGLSAPLVDFATDEHIFRTVPSWSGIDIDRTKHWNRFGILQQGAANGVAVPAIVAGVVRIAVDIRNEFHTHARPKTGSESKMESAFGGCPILWKPDAVTGNEWCVVDLRPQVGHIVEGYLTSSGLTCAVEAGDTVGVGVGTLMVYAEDPDAMDPWFDTLDTIPLEHYDETLEAEGFALAGARWLGPDHWRPAWISCGPSEFPQP